MEVIDNQPSETEPILVADDVKVIEKPVEKPIEISHQSINNLDDTKPKAKRPLGRNKKFIKVKNNIQTHKDNNKTLEETSL